MEEEDFAGRRRGRTDPAWPLAMPGQGCRVRGKYTLNVDVKRMGFFRFTSRVAGGGESLNIELRTLNVERRSEENGAFPGHVWTIMDVDRKLGIRDWILGKRKSGGRRLQQGAGKNKSDLVFEIG
jgi:hypothetical protein